VEDYDADPPALGGLRGISAWLVLAAITFTLTRSAGALTSTSAPAPSARVATTGHIAAWSR
jgi:hypothetical protein